MAEEVAIPLRKSALNKDLSLTDSKLHIMSISKITWAQNSSSRRRLGSVLNVGIIFFSPIFKFIYITPWGIPL